MGPPHIGKCANPDCHVEFKRLGTGRIYTLPVTQSEAWGLPADVKQKVVWLCSKCAAGKEVEFDREHFRVQIVSRHQSHRQTA